MRKNFAIVISIVAIAVLVALLAPLHYGKPATAAPAAAPAFAPTPVAGVVRGGNASPPKYGVFLGGTTVITADMRTGCIPTSGYDLVDLQWKMDQGTPNTTTLTLHYTNDQVTFDVGPAIVAANAADANDMQQFALFGRFVCVDVNATNSNGFTPTITGLFK